MAFKSKKEEKKKKGPKGKRARAKAKLERQWGETVDESKLPALRRGKSRILQHESQRSSRVKEREAHSDDDDNQESMDVYLSSEESDNEDGGALNLLLQSIRKKTRSTITQHERMERDEDHCEGPDDDESDSEMSLTEDVQQTVEESDVEDEAAVSEDNAVGDDDESHDIDPFSLHFNREPLSEKELAQALTVSQKTAKVLLPGLESALELQLNAGSEEADAMSSFACNRKVLRQTWRRVNAQVLRGNKKLSLSSLQSALYPSLASYKDAFIAAETREVSSN